METPDRREMNQVCSSVRTQKESWATYCFCTDGITGYQANKREIHEGQRLSGVQ